MSRIHITWNTRKNRAETEENLEVNRMTDMKNVVVLNLEAEVNLSTVLVDQDQGLIVEGNIVDQEADLILGVNQNIVEEIKIEEQGGTHVHEILLALDILHVLDIPHALGTLSRDPGLEVSLNYISRTDQTDTEGIVKNTQIMRKNL